MATIRRPAVCVGLLALLAVSTAAAAGLVKVTSGRWDGRTWTFAARVETSALNVSYCSRLTFASGPGGSNGCSTYLSTANVPSLPFYGMDLGEVVVRCPGIAYVDGPVTSSAKTV